MFTPLPQAEAHPHEERAPRASLRWRFVDNYRWAAFVLPFVVYMLLGSLEPHGTNPWIDAAYYPWFYLLKVLGTAASLWLVWPGFRHLQPPRFSPLALVVGGLGVVVWVGLCELRLEARLVSLLGLEHWLEPGQAPRWLQALLEAGKRPGYNPLEKIASLPLAYSFLCVRFLGLAVIVPLMEEAFWRLFLMRYITDPQWWRVGFGSVDRGAIIMTTLLAVSLHPGEMLAMALWFSAVTWLMLRTRNFWDCVMAHATTNFLLGGYVLVSGDWSYL